jgi:hypothetical protein
MTKILDEVKAGIVGGDDVQKIFQISLVRANARKASTGESRHFQATCANTTLRPILIMSDISRKVVSFGSENRQT